MAFPPVVSTKNLINISKSNLYSSLDISYSLSGTFPLKVKTPKPRSS